MRKFSLFKLLPWFMVFLCMGMIFYFSSQTANESARLSFNFSKYFALNVAMWIIRKGAHFTEFALLGFLISVAFRVTMKSLKPIISFIITFIYACSDEFHQIFVEGRACRAFDVMVDSIGGFTGIVISVLVILLITSIKKND